MAYARIVLRWVSGLLLLTACSDSTAPGEEAKQQVFIYAFTNDYYWDSGTSTVVEVRNASAGGVVYGDPLHQFEYYALNNSRFEQEAYHQIYPGYISFGDFVSSTAGRVTSGYDPLTVKVKTSAGQLSGQLSPPANLTLLGNSNADSLSAGDDLNLFWSGSDADFYYLTFDYAWVDSAGFLHFTTMEKFVDATVFTMPADTFLSNGQISNSSVQPMNGPLPQVGAGGTMQGTGHGFFYYPGRTAGYGGNPIIVMDGLPSPVPAILPGMNAGTLQQRIQNHIRPK